MFTTPHRQKGGAPQLGAKGPQRCGPFGWWPDDDHLDDDQDDEPVSTMGDTDY